MSQAFIKIASGDVPGLGVLLNGLVLNELHSPESWSKSIISSFVDALLKALKSSTSLISISTDMNLLFSPLLIELIVPELGAVINTPRFFYLQEFFVLLAQNHQL